MSYHLNKTKFLNDFQVKWKIIEINFYYFQFASSYIVQ